MFPSINNNNVIYMFTGISLVYTVPTKAPPSLLSFLQPFSGELCMTIGFSKTFLYL